MIQVQSLRRFVQAVLTGALLFCVSSATRADEGMWLLGRTDPKAMAAARSLGLQLTDQQLYGEDGMSLKDCVVSFSDYCSGVIVSADGLLFTNHHCGFSAIQQLSTPQDDILGNGFVAHTYAEERPAKGIFVKIWQRTINVTAQVQHELDSIYAAAGKSLKEKQKAELYSKHITSILMGVASRAERKAKAEAKAKRLGNKVAFSIEKQTSKVRASNDDAEKAVADIAEDIDDIDTDAEGADEVLAALAELKEHKASLPEARKDIDEDVGDWYACVDDAPEAQGAISYGEGADFALDEDDFVAKWGQANDRFFGSGPLAGYGETIAKAAYEYKVDPRLCAAVSIIESSGGVYCIRPHNAWGWGAADSNPYALASEWGSWKEAIEAWHKGMATSSTGLANAATLDELGSIYCSTAHWSADVATEMEQISEIAVQVEEELEAQKALEDEGAKGAAKGTAKGAKGTKSAKAAKDDDAE